MAGEEPVNSACFIGAPLVLTAHLGDLLAGKDKPTGWKGHEKP